MQHSVASAAGHAARGASTSFAAILALATALVNRQALRRLDTAALRLVRPSRNVAAFAVFVGAFRFVQRLAAAKANVRAKQEAEMGDAHSKPKRTPPSETNVDGAVPASVTAGVLATLCLPPRHRPAVMSLLSTNALSLLFRDVVARNPRLAMLAPLELAAFMAACGWIYYSGFFHPESYERAHMNLLLRYTLLRREATEWLQEQYRLGLNPNPCAIRHPGQSCREFYTRSDFFSRVINLSLRVYLPVHLTTWLASLRHAKVRAAPLSELAAKFVSRLARSASYFFGFVGVGWAFSCLAGPLGDHSLAMRKLQFLLCGSLPSAALLLELPSRRRPIGVILTSYVLVSVASVATKDLKWLQRGRGPVRTLLEAACVAAAVAYTIEGSLSSSRVLQRLLLGYSSPRAPTEQKSDKKVAIENDDTAVVSQ